MSQLVLQKGQSNDARNNRASPIAEKDRELAHMLDTVIGNYSEAGPQTATAQSGLPPASLPPRSLVH